MKNILFGAKAMKIIWEPAKTPKFLRKRRNKKVT